MTEQEIIEYLKENKTRGVVFGLFPEDVQNWCRKYRDKNIFEYFRFDRIWEGLLKLCPRSDTAYCLKSDYIPEIGFKEHWQEFEIDEDGYFYSSSGWRYHYREDVRFEVENSDKFKGFGGWLYECNDGPVWVMMPHVAYEGNLYIYLSLDGNQHEITAPIPSKIRFWRYQE